MSVRWSRAGLVPGALLIGIVWLTAGPSAQGLGAVAKREVARRQQVSGGKKYTNDDLAAVPAAAPVAPAAGGTESAAKPPATADGSSTGAEESDGLSAEARAVAEAQAPEKLRPESYWRDKARSIRAAQEKTNARLAGLKQRLDSLEAQLRAGAGSSHTQERDVTLKALASAEEDARAMKGEWDRLEGRAKAEKVPSEWLR